MSSYGNYKEIKGFKLFKFFTSNLARLFESKHILVICFASGNFCHNKDTRANRRWPFVQEMFFSYCYIFTIIIQRTIDAKGIMKAKFRVGCF
jgi:hypothetical protein